MHSLSLKGVKKPELVLGLVGPLGAPVDKVSELLTQSLKAVDYTSHVIRLSTFLGAYGSLPTAHPDAEAEPADRWNRLMSRGWVNKCVNVSGGVFPLVE